MLYTHAKFSIQGYVGAIRTVFSGFALLLTGFALMQLRHRAG